jgi:hypothetical protein
MENGSGHLAVPTGLVTGLDYYDTVLAAILLLLVLGVTVSIHPAVAFHQGLAGGSLATTVLLYEVLFRNPPVEPTRSTTAASALVGGGWILALLASL